MKYVILLASLLFCGCAVIPHTIKDTSYAPDSSTPSQYTQYNNGILYTEVTLKNEVIAVVITPHKRDEYNILIEKYAGLMLKQKNVKLEKDSGVEPFKDKFENDVYRIKAEYFKYLCTMKRWSRNGVEP